MSAISILTGLDTYDDLRSLEKAISGKTLVDVRNLHPGQNFNKVSAREVSDTFPEIEDALRFVNVMKTFARAFNITFDAESFKAKVKQLLSDTSVSATEEVDLNDIELPKQDADFDVKNLEEFLPPNMNSSKIGIWLLSKGKDEIEKAKKEKIKGKLYKFGGYNIAIRFPSDRDRVGMFEITIPRLVAYTAIETSKKLVAEKTMSKIGLNLGWHCFYDDRVLQYYKQSMKIGTDIQAYEFVMVTLPRLKPHRGMPITENIAKLWITFSILNDAYNFEKTKKDDFNFTVDIWSKLTTLGYSIDPKEYVDTTKKIGRLCNKFRKVKMVLDSSIDKLIRDLKPSTIVAQDKNLSVDEILNE